MIKRFLTLWLATLLLASQAWGNDEVTEKDIRRLKSQIDRLQSQLSDFKGKQGALQEQLRYSEKQIGELGRSIAAIEGQIKRQQASLKNLRKRQGNLKAKQREQEALISEQIRIAFQLGRSNHIKMLLNQESPESVSRAVKYLEYVNAARVEQIRAYNGTLVELDRLAPAIINEELRLQSTRTNLDTEVAKLKKEQTSRKIALAAINEAIISKDQELQNRKAERQRLERLLVAVEQAVANLALPPEYRAFTELRGKMRWPVSGKMINTYGSRKSSGGLRWQGVSLRAPEGSPVRSIHNGRVVFSDWFKGSGLLVIVDHGNGYMSLYAHNQSLLKETGDWIKAGEAIATVGSSGGQTETALYFEIRHDGKPVNPNKWCSNRA